MNIAYGHQIVSDNDENINLAENLSQAFARSGSLVTTPPDLLPICEFLSLLQTIPVTEGHSVRYVPAWVPGAWWSKCGRDDRKAIHDAFNVPFDRVSEQMVCSHHQHEIFSLTKVAHKRTKGQHRHRSSPAICLRSCLKERQPRKILTTSEGRLGQSIQVRYDH
jgi:hypothetical protein